MAHFSVRSGQRLGTTDDFRTKHHLNLVAAHAAGFGLLGDVDGPDSSCRALSSAKN
jgi:hypothetical protein